MNVLTTATLKVTSNKKNCTFTISKIENGKEWMRYRTISFIRPEFEEMCYNTESDWQDFLQHSDAYYKVSK